MNDHVFLDFYAKHINLMQNHGYVGVLDVNYNYVAITDGAATLLKKNAIEHLSLNFINDVHRPDWIKKAKLKILNQAFSSELPQSYITITNSELFSFPALLFCICVIKNPDTGNVVGYEITGSTVDHRGSIQLNTLIENTDADSIFRTMTTHELDILYFKCQKKSDIEVANMLELIYNKSISPKTINNILRQQLYPKFNVINLIGLIEKAKLIGVDNLNLLDIIHHDTIIELPSDLLVFFHNA